MTNDVWDNLYLSDDFQRLLDTLGDAPPNEAEGEDVTFSADERQMRQIRTSVCRVTQSILSGMQHDALSNPDTGHALHALNRACGMVACGHSKLKAAHAIYTQIRPFTQTVVWGVYANEIHRLTGYEHSNIALLCDLIEAALNTDDDI